MPSIPTADRPRRAAYIPGLDGLRGLAILGVLMLHTVPSQPVNSALAHTYNSILRSGMFGVDLFFVLSGFLITGILLDTKTQTQYFRNFYARRFLRLFPVYYGYLLLLATIVPLIHRLVRFPDYEGNWWWYTTYLSNWKPNSEHDPYLGQFWSLAVEEQFYLLWPSVVYLLSKRALPWLCSALCATAVVFRCLPLQLDAYRATIGRMDALALGALMALAVRDEYWSALLKKYWKKIATVAVAGFIAATWVNPTDVWTPLNAFAAAMFFGVIVFRVAQPEGGLLDKALTSRPLVSYGKYSYCIYVTHLLISTHVGALSTKLSRTLHLPHTSAVGIQIVVVNAAIFAVAWCSWRFYESPILRLKQRFQE